MIDFYATDHTCKYYDMFTNFCLIRRKVYTAMENQIIFYKQKDIKKNSLILILYLPTSLIFLFWLTIFIVWVVYAIIILILSWST